MGFRWYHYGLVLLLVLSSYTRPATAPEGLAGLIGALLGTFLLVGILTVLWPWGSSDGEEPAEEPA